MRLNGLLHTTATRLVSTLKTPLDTSIPMKLTMTSKMGCDAASGYSEYSQLYKNEDHCDTHLFTVTLAPLRLYEAGKTILYKNPHPSSTRSCRPVKLIWHKETPDLIKSVVGDMRAQIASLEPTRIGNIEIHHDVHMTMMDGKVINTLTDTKCSKVCYICKAPPSAMNDLDQVKMRPVDQAALQYGIAPLHCHIRCFEYLLHIGYKIEAQARREEYPEIFEKLPRTATKEEKTAHAEKKKKKLEEEEQLISEKKKKVQAAFWEKLGIHVDKVKQGFGSTNDGNTARKFFANPEISASILGLNENLLKRFSTLLTVISTTQEVDHAAFEKYAFDTARLCVELYGWYIMPPTAHKLLLHGAAIMAALPLPAGQFSEEAQESSHKVCKKAKLDRTRKCSRENANEDLLHFLLVSSCPVVTSLFSKDAVKREYFLSDDVLSLLKSPS